MNRQLLKNLPKNRDLQKYNIYPSFRPHQEETINKILDIIESGKKSTIVVEAPTGSGKSLIAKVVSDYLTNQYESNYRGSNGEKINWRNFIVTPSKMLMDQYCSEFTENDIMAPIKGQDNYICQINKRKFSEGVCQSASKVNSEKFPCLSTCPYLLARNKARSHPLTLTNFNYILLEFDFVRKLGKRDLLICDEAHNLESIIMDYYSIDITSSTIDKINQIIKDIIYKDEYPWNYCNKIIEAKLFNKQISLIDIKKIIDDIDIDSGDDIYTVKDWLENIIQEKISAIIVGMDKVLESKIRELEENSSPEEVSRQIENDPNLKTFNKKIKFLKNFSYRISNFKRDFEKTIWIVDYEEDSKNQYIGFKIKPVKVDHVTDNVISRISDFRIFMSATICNFEKFCKNIGIDIDDAEFITLPTSFPAENRPFILTPIAYINYKNKREVLPYLTETIDDILESHKSEKGIIHSVSYENAQYLSENSTKKNRLIIPTSSKTKDKLLKEFYESENGVFVSPSITEGLDLKGDLSRFQILMKIPFLSLADKQIRKRKEIDQDWYALGTILTILQAVGRSVRSPEDYAVTYALDGNMNILLSNYNDYFPEDFKNTIMSVDGL